jgi:hypothetical protein
MAKTQSQLPGVAAATAAKVRNPPILFQKTQKVISQIEAKLGQRLVTYWNSPNGSICNNDVTGLYGILRSIKKVDRLSLFIKSDGGSGQASLRMVNLLRQFVGRLTVLVPLECESAATMLALGADQILMGPLAHLSAVDTSLTHDLSPIDAITIVLASARMNYNASCVCGKDKPGKRVRTLSSPCLVTFIRSSSELLIVRARCLRSCA